jgi:hypothetical protein
MILHYYLKSPRVHRLYSPWIRYIKFWCIHIHIRHVDFQEHGYYLWARGYLAALQRLSLIAHPLETVIFQEDDEIDDR